MAAPRRPCGTGSPMRLPGASFFASRPSATSMPTSASIGSAVRLTPLACDVTDDDGHGALSFMTAPGRNMIMVGREPSSDDGGFKFTLVRPEPSSQTPGALPRRGVRSSVDALSDFDDAWWLQMRTGITYRMNGSGPRSVCHAVALPAGDTLVRRRGAAKVLHCGGYLTYTPGQGAGGRYTVLVTATGTRPGRQRYRLQAALAGPDDMAPGVRIENPRRARIALRDRCRRSLPLPGPRAERRHAHACRTRLGPSDPARRDGPSHHLVRRHRRAEHASVAGRYFVVVRADGAGHGRYRLSLLERGITTTTVLANGAGSLTLLRGARRDRSRRRLQLIGNREAPDRPLRSALGLALPKVYRLRLGGNGRTGIVFRPPTVGAGAYGRRWGKP